MIRLIRTGNLSILMVLILAATSRRAEPILKVDMTDVSAKQQRQTVPLGSAEFAA